MFDHWGSTLTLTFLRCEQNRCSDIYTWQPAAVKITFMLFACFLFNVFISSLCSSTCLPKSSPIPNKEQITLICKTSILGLPLTWFCGLYHTAYYFFYLNAITYIAVNQRQELTLAFKSNSKEFIMTTLSLSLTCFCFCL